MSASSSTPPILLFGYDSSPFTQKIRLTLHLRRLPYTFVLVPSMMPRPILLSLFGLTYRKIPVLAIGRDVYIDTSLILEALHYHPSLCSSALPISSHPTLHPDAGTRTLARLLSSHYTDRPLFRLTTGLIPHTVWRTHFGTDRAGLIGHTLDPNKLQSKVPRNLSQLDTFLSILEPLFADLSSSTTPQGQKWMLGTNRPSAADLSLFYQLQWGRAISKGEGICDLTGGGTPDGEGEGMEKVFNQERYPGLWTWYKRFERYADALESLETRVERGDESGLRRAVEQLARYIGASRSGRAGEETVLLPTANSRIEELEVRNGLKLGSTVRIAPDDTGRGNPTTGILVGASPEEVVITPVTAKDGNEAKITGVNLHFPKVGFVVTPLKQSKL